RDRTVKSRLAPGRSTNRRGRTASHAVAARSPPRRPIFGRPRRSREKPARATSTEIGPRPGFTTRTVAIPEPASVTRAGVAVSASIGLDVLAPAEAGTSTTAARLRAAARLIDQSP